MSVTEYIPISSQNLTHPMIAIAVMPRIKLPKPKACFPRLDCRISGSITKSPPSISTDAA